MNVADCPNLAVPLTVMQHVMRVESGFNPYAIGVVGGRLVRQPRNLPEAVATAGMLEKNGFNFSVGLAQVNRYNLSRYGMPSYEKAFDACDNIRVGSQILRACYQRAGDWGKALSCYYSGNFTTGFKHGYVQKVMATMQPMLVAQSEVAPIPVVRYSSRKAPAAVASMVGKASTPAAQTAAPASGQASGAATTLPPPPKDESFVF